MPERLAICRLAPDSRIPEGVCQLSFYSITRTQDELSIVLPELHAEAAWQAEKGWRVLKVLGPLDFNLTGILAGISGVLADAGVSLFAISTYDTDYIMVKEDALDRTISALSGEGFIIK